MYNFFMIFLSNFFLFFQVENNEADICGSDDDVVFDPFLNKCTKC